MAGSRCGCRECVRLHQRTVCGPLDCRCFGGSGLGKAAALGGKSSMDQKTWVGFTGQEVSRPSLKTLRPQQMMLEFGME